jgi:hypothetical protein
MLRCGAAVHGGAFQRLGEGIEKVPGVPGVKCVVARLAPLVKHARDQFVRAHSDSAGADHEVMRGAVFDFGERVDREPGILMVAAIHHRAGGRA